jgi:hypothetical protein
MVEIEPPLSPKRQPLFKALEGRICISPSFGENLDETPVATSDAMQVPRRRYEGFGSREARCSYQLP